LRNVVLRELGWPEGHAPTWGQLVSHIVDCLEFGLAMDPVEASSTLWQADDDAGEDFRDFDDDDDDPPAYSRGYAAAADGSGGYDDAAITCATEGWEMGSDSGS